MIINKKDFFDYFSNIKNIKRFKRKKGKISITDTSNHTFSIKLEKNTIERLLLFYVKNLGSNVKSSLDFVNKFKTCTIKSKVKDLSTKSFPGKKPYILWDFINEINKIMQTQNLLQINDFETNFYSLKFYPFIHIYESSEKIVIDTTALKSFLNTTKIHINQKISLDNLVKDTYHVNRGSLKRLILQEKYSSFNDIVSDFLNLTNSSYFFKNVDSVFKELEGIEEKESEEKESEEKDKRDIDEVIDYGFSGGADSIFSYLNSLSINYKDKGANDHFSGKVISLIIEKGLGKDFAYKMGASWKFGNGDDGKRFMDNTKKGQKFLWCGATVALLLKDKVPKSVRKNFRSALNLYYTFARDKDICVFSDPEQTKKIRKDQIKEGDVICIATTARESGGAKSSKGGNHICYVKSVNVKGDYITSVNTYEGNTNVSGKNTVATKTRKSKDIVFAYRFTDLDSASKYKIFDEILPGLKSIDYQILYNVFLRKTKKVKTADNIFNLLKKKKLSKRYNAIKNKKEKIEKILGNLALDTRKKTIKDVTDQVSGS